MRNCCELVVRCICYLITALFKKDNMANKGKAPVTKSEDIPEDVKEMKEALEKETGKKYRYRKPKSDMPSIQHMLVHGPPGKEGKQKTFLDMVAFPLILLVLFVISLFIFLNAPHANSKRNKHVLPKQNRRPPGQPRVEVNPHEPDEF